MWQPSTLLYVVTLTLNGLAHTQALIRALAESTIPLRVIVLDQASTDGTLDWLRQLKGRGHLVLPLEFNIGVAAGWNLGIRTAIANGAQAVLVCGNDTAPMPGTVERLVAHVRAGVPLITGTAAAYNAPYEAPATPVSAAPPADAPLWAAPDFSFFLLSGITIETLARHEATTGANISPWELGLFDSRFTPAYFEDNDFHLRLHRAGLFAGRDPQALFRHDCSLTIRTNPQIAAENTETFRRNAEFFRQKWGGLPHELPDMPLQARPLNVSDAQWEQMTGGRPVLQIDYATQVAVARQVYERYGIKTA